jgi:FtsP/CotA-like multicopper oxidase with cupredoxin domain
MNLQVGPRTVKRRIKLLRENGLWTINGTTWGKVVDSNFTRVEANPPLGSVEVWTIENRSGGWFHPFHIHLVDFKILDRNGKPPFAYERGPKDVVYLGENEIVRVIMKFDGACGKYMMHCHNLVHEDHDMMSQFEVVAPPGGYVGDPLGTPPSYLPEGPFGT